MNLNHLCLIRESPLAVNRELVKFWRPFVRSNRHHVPLNRNYNACARQQIQRPVWCEAAMHTMVVQHYQCPLVNRLRQSPYRNLCSTVADANLYWKISSIKMLSVKVKKKIEFAYQMHFFGFGMNGSLRNFRRISVQVSATTVCDNVSMCSASLPEIQPSNSVSLTFENE